MKGEVKGLLLITSFFILVYEISTVNGAVASEGDGAGLDKIGEVLAIPTGC
jgi:hypothetical protein